MTKRQVKIWCLITLSAGRNRDLLGRILSWILMLFIISNALAVFVVFDDSFASYAKGGIVIFDTISSIVFFTEYVLRVWTADLLYQRKTPWRGRLRYILSPMGIIDLLSFLPGIACGFGFIGPQTLNALRIMKVLRLIKFSRYMRGMHVIAQVFLDRSREIIAAFGVIFLLTLTSSVLMYQVEHPVQPDVFKNVWSGIYWAISTITSTGYGDMVPLTNAGRFIGFITMVCSIGVVAIPSGIFTAGFMYKMREASDAGEDIEELPGDIVLRERGFEEPEEKPEHAAKGQHSGQEMHSSGDTTVLHATSHDDDSTICIDQNDACAMHTASHVDGSAICRNVGDTCAVYEETLSTDSAEPKGAAPYPQEWAYCPHCGKPLR